MNIFSLFSLICAIACVILVIVTSVYGKTKLHKILLIFNFVVFLWGIGCFIAGIAENPKAAIFGWRLAHLGGVFVSTVFLHLVCVFCKTQHRKLLTFAYAQAVFFSILNLVFDVLITETRYVFGIYYNKANLILYMAVLAYLSIVFIAFYRLIKFFPKAKGVVRSQTTYILISFLFGFLGGTSTFLPEFLIDKIYPFGNIGILIYSVILSYAILKHRILDFDLFITRTGIFVAVYSLVLGIPFIVGYRLLGGGAWLLPVSLMAVFATIGPFIYLFIQKKAEDKLLQEQRQYQSTLRHASLGMGRIKDLKRLLNLIVRIVTRAVKIEHCEIYLYHEPSQQFILKASKGKLKNVKERMSAISGNAMLTKIFHSLREPLVADEIYQRTNDPNADPLCMTLKRLEAALVVPSYIEKRLIAIFVLGRKISGAIYSQDDLAVFSILANQSGLAIENAQYYEDTKRTQAQLLRAEKMATIGTMADGLSHQINNRLHAMGFIAGDALDTIRMSKKNKNGAKPKDLIKDVQFALERIQENVKRGGEIVEGLLKYTRKGSEGLGPVDLNKLVDAAMEMAQFKMRKGEIEIIKQYAKSVPKIKGNFTQLQEVFFNIIDNSYDAMMQRKEELKEKDFKGIITIDAKQRLKDIEITLEDNGIGVKKENKNKLFTPFFTTKLSSKKGTGLGLYVIRQIIEDNHSGEVQFNSTYRKGSRTTITLPTV